MTRKVLALVAVLAASSGVSAQSPDIDTPLLAAPANMREGATVIKWKPDFTYDTLKKGTNRLVCYDRSGQPGQQPFSLECTSLGNLDRVAQNMKFEASADKGKALLRGRRKGRHAREARVRVGVLQPGWPGAGEGPTPHHRRCPIRHGADASACPTTTSRAACGS